MKGINPKQKHTKFRGQLQKFNFNVGEQVKNFIVKRVFQSKDFNAIYYEFEHLPSQARYVHFSTNQKNNQGSLMLYTPSFDNRGLSHICHRITCAGSDKYPVRDAWSYMHSRSLNPRHLAPYQGPDYAIYPIQSCIHKDFYNLMDLNFEQVFKPMGREVDFLLEGVRKQIVGYELLARGEVYEEMKNNFNMGEFIHSQAINQSLLKGSTYEFCAGGIPQEMLNLDYSDVEKYMKQYMNVSNCTILTSGDLDLSSHLQYLDRKLMEFPSSSLQGYQQSNYKLQGNDPQSRLKIQYTPQESESLTHLNLSFRGPDLSKDPHDFMMFGVLGFLLHDIDGIGMSQFLSNESPRYCFNYGCELGMRQQILNLGVGTTLGLNDIEQQLINYLYQLRNDPWSVIPKEIISRVSNKMQLQRQVNLEDIYQYVLHRVDPKYYLSQQFVISNIEQSIPKLIDKYLNNYTTVITEINVDSIYDREQREKQLLKQIYQTLTNEDIQKISQQSLIVNSEQDKLQTIESLPRLLLSETLPIIDKITNQKVNLQYGIPLTFQTQRFSNTTNIIIQFNISDLPQKDLNVVNLMQFLHPQLHIMSEQPGDLTCQIIETNKQLFLNVSFQFLEQEIEAALSGLTSTISDPEFDDHSKISEALHIASAQVGNELVENAMKYAIDYVSTKQFSLIDQARNLCQVEVELLQNLNIKPVLNRITNDLVRTYFKLINCNKIKIFTSTNPLFHQLIQTHMNLFISNLKLQFEGFTLNEKEFNTQYEVIPTRITEQLKKSFIAIPSGSNYVTESFQLNSPFGTQKCTVYHLLSSLLSQILLQHSTLNQLSCNYCPIRSTLTFYSFKDPNILKSFQVFENSIQDVIEADYEYNQTINKLSLNSSKTALISRFYQVEAPYNVNEFLYGVTEQEKGGYLQTLLLVQSEQVKQAASEILLMMAKGLSSQVIMGSHSKALDQLVKRGWLIERAIDDVSVRPEQYAQNQKTYYEVNELLK